jgi:GxxExxY protein
MLLYEKETFLIRSAILAVKRKYGSGFKETIFQKALAEEFSQKNIPYISQPQINIYSVDTGRKIGVYVPDFLVFNNIIVEIKSLPLDHRQSEVQLIQYLKATKYEIGILANFGKPFINIKRFIYTNDRKPWLKNI